jgi:hypothetical protein
MKQSISNAIASRLRWWAPLAVLVIGAAHAQVPTESAKVQGLKGGATVLGTYGCVYVNAKPTAGRADILKSTDGSKMTLVLSADKEQTEDVWVVAETGPKEGTGGRCETTVQKTFLVSYQDTPTVSRDALGASFNVLVAAFVLALLLESAFALLFNWRLFQVYFIGKAWRTPIMLASAWLVVEAFNFDLMAALMSAYYPGSATRTAHGWHTSLLTAMILAGGSVGVNRILTTLNFRSQLPKEGAEVEELKQSGAAYVAVKVDGPTRVVVQRTVSAASGNATNIPMLVGFTKTKAPRVLELLFGDPNRVPRSGGFRVDASQFHRISVTDPSGDVYDLQGKKIASHAAAPEYLFAPGAIVDFRLKI